MVYGVETGRRYPSRKTFEVYNDDMYGASNFHGTNEAQFSLCDAITKSETTRHSMSSVWLALRLQHKRQYGQRSGCYTPKTLKRSTHVVEFYTEPSWHDGSSVDLQSCYRDHKILSESTHIGNKAHSISRRKFQMGLVKRLARVDTSSARRKPFRFLVISIIESFFSCLPCHG